MYLTLIILSLVSTERREEQIMSSYEKKEYHKQKNFICKKYSL